MLLYCFSICFSYEKFHQEIFKRKEIFKWNSYPEKFENQKNRIQCCLKKNTPVFNLKEVFQSRRWLSTLFTLKDKINKMLHPDSTIVYKCNICNDLYYGKAKHHFKFRACEHLGITPLTRKMVKKTQKRVSDHNSQMGHNAYFDDFETLFKESDEFRLLRKLLLILRDDPPLNRCFKLIPMELLP